MKNEDYFIISGKKRVVIKEISKYETPTVQEIRSIMKLLPEYHPYKASLGLILIQGLRPAEVSGLNWNNFVFDTQKKEIISMNHLIYKPRNTKHYRSTTHLYKKIEKPFYSKWLSDQLIGYKERYPALEHNKVFPFSNSDVFNAIFKRLRKKYGKKLPFLLDKVSYTIEGDPYRCRHRIHAYALRHFSFTYHYWNTFNQDVLALTRAFGHSRPETAFKHYIFPKQTIGLDKSYSNIDDFLAFVPKDQTTLPGFKKELIFDENQKSLSDFIY